MTDTDEPWYKTLFFDRAIWYSTDKQNVGLKSHPERLQVTTKSQRLVKICPTPRSEHRTSKLQQIIKQPPISITRLWFYSYFCSCFYPYSCPCSWSYPCPCRYTLVDQGVVETVEIRTTKDLKPFLSLNISSVANNLFWLLHTSPALSV